MSPNVGESCVGPDPNKNYITSSNGSCNFSSCKPGYIIDSSSSDCIKIIPGNPCDGDDPNGNFVYDSNNICNPSPERPCKPGYGQIFGQCYRVNNTDCDSLGLIASPAPNTTYSLKTTVDGGYANCSVGCVPFYSYNGDTCNYVKAGACSGSDPNGIYTYIDGNCVESSCKFGYYQDTLYGNCIKNNDI